MKRIYAYSISLFISGCVFNAGAQDTVYIPLKIKTGIEVSGPVIYFTDKNNLNLEGFISFDRNEKLSFVAEGGFSEFNYSQFNYDFSSRGVFIRAGADYNLLKPAQAAGKYWAGAGLRYGVSLYSSEIPSFHHDNYWGTSSSSVPARKNTGHFIELTPGVKTELIKNLSIGWTVRLKLLLSGGGGRDLRPIFLPGYGDGGRTAVANFSYYIVWNIPYKTRRVIIRPEAPEEEEEEVSEPVEPLP